MQIDFAKLDGRQFEMLCGALLAAEGFADLHQFAKPGTPDRGIDWISTIPGGARVIAQVKLLRGQASVSVLRQAARDLESGLALLGASRALLMVSTDVSPRMQQTIELEAPHIELWDANALRSRLGMHPHLLQQFRLIVDTQNQVNELLEQLGEPAAVRDPAADLIKRLEEVRPGRDDWRDFEDICVDILNYCFLPPLRPPRIQTWSEDGLDRRDAIYPIGSGNAFWESIKYDFASRMIVAEFKNHAEHVGQAEVESIQQYLLPKAMRCVGLLCSRSEPSDSALKARRRAWMISGNLILFVSDDGLREMVNCRSSGEDPSVVLDRQIDDFFNFLAP